MPAPDLRAPPLTFWRGAFALSGVHCAFPATLAAAPVINSGLLITEIPPSMFTEADKNNWLDDIRQNAERAGEVLLDQSTDRIQTSKKYAISAVVMGLSAFLPVAPLGLAVGGGILAVYAGEGWLVGRSLARRREEQVALSLLSPPELLSFVRARNSAAGLAARAAVQMERVKQSLAGHSFSFAVQALAVIVIFATGVGFLAAAVASLISAGAVVAGIKAWGQTAELSRWKRSLPGDKGVLLEMVEQSESEAAGSVHPLQVLHDLMSDGVLVRPPRPAAVQKDVSTSAPSRSEAPAVLGSQSVAIQLPTVSDLSGATCSDGVAPLLPLLSPAESVSQFKI